MVITFRIGLNNYCKLRFDVCISQCQNIPPRFLTIASFETTPFPKCRVDTTLVYFSREERKRGERHDRGGRGNVPELSASVRQS